jgi:hypothetical protein
VLGFAFVAAYESAVALQPSQAGLDDPAVPAEPLGRVDSFACDPAAADLVPQGLDVVCLVGVEFGGSVTGPSLRAGDGCDRVEQWYEDLGVVDVPGGGQDGQW